MNKTEKSPKHLSAEAKAWWERIQNEYSVQDSGGVFLLTSMLESFDQMRAAQALITSDGLVCRDRYDQVKANPATVVARDARSAMLQAMKQLGLDIPVPGTNKGRK
jgi:P27 family predicted phage terminase small subunit